MPWKENNVMDERVKFISRLLSGEGMSELCREFEISRKTGYKFKTRYLSHGVRGLVDLTRQPHFHPHRTPKSTEGLILKLRKTKPSWGPKKLRARLELDHPDIHMPAESTIDEILKRYNVPRQKSKRRRFQVESTGPLRNSAAPNDVWSVDFKGEYRLGNGKYCYPLTISDHYSRYLLECEALENTSLDGVWSCFERVFQKYGLPTVIRSDNGAPFSSRAINGWSQLAVWWLRLGIKPERIEPGHPEQNGRHERIHWTLKYEATRPPSPNLFHQQARFDNFRHSYNYFRPHEALNMKLPANLYKKSDTPYPNGLPKLDYPLHDVVRTVSSNGTVYLQKRVKFYITKALAGEDVGFKESKPGIWQVNFMDFELGYFDEQSRMFNYNDSVLSLD